MRLNDPAFSKHGFWRGRRSSRAGAGIVAAILLAALGAGPAKSQPAPAAPEPVETRFAPDVVEQFRAIPERAEALGWYLDGGPNPTVCKHWQGIARSNGLGTPYLFVTRSGNNTVACPGAGDDHSGNLVIIRMDSRDPYGERLRSNRLVHDTDTDDSPPPVNDRLVKVINFDGSSSNGNTWPHYYHPGGVQLLDDVLVVPLETPATSGLPENLILFLDVSDPENPTILSRFDPGERASWTAGLAAVTPLPDGRYLMLVAGAKNEVLRVFTSEPTEADGTTDLRSADLSWSLFDDVTEEELEAVLEPDWPSGGAPTGDAHQMLNFIREVNSVGDLYLFGARNSNSGGPFGEDHVDLYRVVGLEEGIFRLDRVATRHLRAVGTPTHVTLGCCDIANFAAASGTYISPSGELLFYATEHDNDGPNGSVKAGEWRHKHMVRTGSSTYDPTATPGGPYATGEGGSVQLNGSGAPPITQAWLELFADDGFTERSVVIDYPDFDKDDFTDFRDLDGDPGDLDNFSDDPSSMRWFAPIGCTVRVNDDDYGDGDFPGKNTRTLPGTGQVVEFPDLDDVRNDDDSDEIDGEITSVTFFDNCADYYSAPLSLHWDLEGDGSFETSGADPDFSAAQIDGPALVEVELRATHPTDGRTGVSSAMVRVDNLPPTIETAAAFDPTGSEIGVDVPVALVGVPVTVQAKFTDPGIADSQTATLDWGDGTVDASADFEAFSDAAGGETGELKHSHAFGAPGTFDVVVEVVDDDGGRVQATVTVEVVSAEAALELVVDELNERILAATDPRVRAALMRALDDLTGSSGGLGRNGALDELERGNPQAAVVKIGHAVAALEEAEAAGAGDLSTLKDLLLLAARSIAQSALDDARAAADPDNTGTQRQLEEIEAVMTTGATLLAADDHLGAIEAFSDALRRAVALCHC